MSQGSSSTLTGSGPNVLPLRMDQLGNSLDPTVGYARGHILDSEVSESLRQRHAYEMLRARHRRVGDDGVYNLTGLIRGYPFSEGDKEALRSHVHFNVRFEAELEDAAIARMGGDSHCHSGFLATRVTAGMIAIMLSLIEPGDHVLSLVAADRSHPSIRQAITMAGGTMTEFTDPQAFEAALSAHPPKLAVITTISPSKNHLPARFVQQGVTIARSVGARVIIDDAHMMARIALYDEPGGLALGADIALWSLDKHLTGPRSGFVAGDSALIRIIRARALSLGLEAQLAQYVAGLRAVQAFDVSPVREAARLSEKVLEVLKPEMDGLGYLAGAGIAISGENYLRLAMRRARRNNTTIVPIEAVSFSAMRILEEFGGVMIPAIGMPGAAASFRIMFYPDGARFGERNAIEAWRLGLTELTAALDDPERVRQVVLGATI